MGVGRGRFSSSLVALLGAAALFALFVVNVLSLHGLMASRGWISHSQRVQALVSTVRFTLVDAENGKRGYLLGGNADYLQPLENAVVSLPSVLDELKRLTSDDTAQRADVAELETLANRKIDELRSTIDFYRSGEESKALAAVISDGKLLMDHVRRLTADISVLEDARLDRHRSDARRGLDLAMWIGVTAGMGLLLLGSILFLIHRDIARRKALESALREETRFQEQFVGILGHDLRNPLAAIALSAETLRRQELPEGPSFVVGRIASSATRMIRMVTQLLDLTRARLAGGIPVETRPEIDLSTVVRAVVEELRAAHPGAEIVVRDDGPAIGRWDPDRLAQVASNLLANAIVHGVGPVDVRVCVAPASALLEVRNQGEPIPDDVLSRLFEAFRGNASGRANRGSGLGLGLFIADRIVAAHGGRIDARSSAVAGTTFTVHLPIAAHARPGFAPVSAVERAESPRPGLL